VNQVHGGGGKTAKKRGVQKNLTSERQEDEGRLWHDISRFFYLRQKRSAFEQKGGESGERQGKLSKGNMQVREGAV